MYFSIIYFNPFARQESTLRLFGRKHTDAPVLHGPSVLHIWTFQSIVGGGGVPSLIRTRIFFDDVITDAPALAQRFAQTSGVYVPPHNGPYSFISIYQNYIAVSWFIEPETGRPTVEDMEATLIGVLADTLGWESAPPPNRLETDEDYFRICDERRIFEATHRREPKVSWSLGRMPA